MGGVEGRKFLFGRMLEKFEIKNIRRVSKRKIYVDIR